MGAWHENDLFCTLLYVLFRRLQKLFVLICNGVCNEDVHIHHGSVTCYEISVKSSLLVGVQWVLPLCGAD